MMMKTFLNLKNFRCLFFLVIVLIGFSLIIGSGGGDDDSENFDCKVCENNSDCGEGYWCAAFVTGPNRCVPNSVGPSDSYTCTTYY